MHRCASALYALFLYSEFALCPVHSRALLMEGWQWDGKMTPTDT